ncbi:MAG: hypothetical protein HS117_22755 [Verrucomicrobiaceae bacterium]|nr:hypothetical protein [Verrucomicrobiaceae bacterium]
MNHNQTLVRAKDLTPKAEIKGGGGPNDPEDDPPGSQNHNELLIRAKDLTPKAEIKGGVVVHERRGR